MIAAGVTGSLVGYWRATSCVVQSVIFVDFLVANTFQLDSPLAPIARQVGPCADCGVLITWVSWDPAVPDPKRRGRAVLCGHCAGERIAAARAQSVDEAAGA